MPNYSFRCTNEDCQHEFELKLEVSASQSIHFCPICSSMAKRNAADFATVHTIKEQRFYDFPAEARDLKRFTDHHTHGPGCGCVLNHHNEYEPIETTRV
jgi:predicted nucleic acid-binding Zn ribbon protein